MDIQAIAPPVNEEELKKLKVSRLVALEIIRYLHDNGAIITRNGYTHASIDILNSKEILPSEQFDELSGGAIGKDDG